jgi:hypothetical protein
VFEAPKDARVETDFALGKAALLELGPRWPCSLSFDELQQRAEASLAGEQVNWAPDEDSRETLQGFLLNLYAAGVVHFRTYCPPAAAVAGDRPVATPVARWQIQHSHFVTTNLHQAIEVEDEIGRHLLSRLDGTRDRAALVEELREFIQSKGAIEKLGSSDVEIRRAIGQQLEKNLHALARLGLLVE